MLQLTEPYKQAILNLGEDPQLFPLSEDGRWTSTSLAFGSNFSYLRFFELMYTVVHPGDQDDRGYTLNNANAHALENLTAGSTSSVVTSVASKQLALLSDGSADVAILNALATQLQNETSGTTEALLLQAGLSQAEIRSIKQAYAKVESDTATEVMEFSHGTATLVSSSSAAKVISRTKKNKIKK